MSPPKPTIKTAQDALDKVINKTRVHFYKPIQIAEILYRARIFKDIDLNKLETYRKESKAWRNKVTKILVGRTSTSSAKYQDNLFEQNALPPELISILGKENIKTSGSIEKYIYQKFLNKLDDLNSALAYCKDTPYQDFELFKFLEMFEQKPGLKRSVDKVYEIVVYALFASLIKTMGIEINISVKDPNNPILSEFDDFSQKVLGVDFKNIQESYPAKIFRVGVTNAADRGLDMWGNFGLAIQIKHLSLSEQLAESVVGSISADRIVIICKDAEEKIILSILNQIGWRGRIQSIITFADLNKWYGRALKGESAQKLGNIILNAIGEQIKIEFPSTSDDKEKSDFFDERDYFPK